MPFRGLLEQKTAFVQSILEQKSEKIAQNLNRFFHDFESFLTKF